MPTEDFDMVSDLNGGTDDTVSANVGDVALDAAPIRAPGETAKKLDAPKDAAAKPLSLRDQISSALKSDGEATPPVAQQDGGAARNPDGTFATKAAVVPHADIAASAAPLAAPAGIDAAVFASLPAETQAKLARTMEDINIRQQHFARLEGVEQLISPRRDAWALNGMTDAQALNQLLALSDFAGRDPGGFIKYIAQNNKIDLEELVLAQEPVDPQYRELQDQIKELQGHLQGQTRQQQQAAHEQTRNGVLAFASEKGPEGQPLRPHFDELGSDVLPFISAVKTQNPSWSHNQVLQEAYDRACWGTPNVRAKMQVAAALAAEAQRLRDQTARTANARNASVSVRSGSPSSTPTAPNYASRSMRDTIRASIAAHS